MLPRWQAYLHKQKRTGRNDLSFWTQERDQEAGRSRDRSLRDQPERAAYLAAAFLAAVVTSEVAFFTAAVASSPMSLPAAISSSTVSI